MATAFVEQTILSGKPKLWPKPKRAKLRDVEIFSTGEHKGKVYTKSDLDDMVNNFRKFSGPGEGPRHDPPAVIGHEEDQQRLKEHAIHAGGGDQSRTDIPAAGWPKNVRRKGNKLVCDIAHVHPKAADWIANGNYKKVSMEVYEEPPEGMPFKGKAIRRVSFLGGEVPHVKDLAGVPYPEVEAFSEEDEYDLAARHIRFRISEIRSLPDGTVAVFSEVDPMNRDEMLKALEAKGIDRATLEGMDDKQLAACCKAGEGGTAKSEMAESDQLTPEMISQSKSPEEGMKVFKECVTKYIEGWKKKYSEMFGEDMPVQTVDAEDGGAHTEDELEDEESPDDLHEGGDHEDGESTVDDDGEKKDEAQAETAFGEDDDDDEEEAPAGDQDTDAEDATEPEETEQEEGDEDDLKDDDLQDEVGDDDEEDDDEEDEEFAEGERGLKILHDYHKKAVRASDKANKTGSAEDHERAWFDRDMAKHVIGEHARKLPAGHKDAAKLKSVANIHGQHADYHWNEKDAAQKRNPSNGWSSAAGKYSEYSESSIARIVATEVRKALRPVVSKFSESDSRQVDDFLDRMNHAGRISPSELDTASGVFTLRQQLLSLDDTAPVGKFKEGSGSGRVREMTARQAMMEEIRQRPQRFNEKTKVYKDGVVETFSEADLEVSRVSKFAESISGELAKLGETPEKFVETYKSSDSKQRAEMMILLKRSAAEKGLPI